MNISLKSGLYFVFLAVIAVSAYYLIDNGAPEKKFRVGILIDQDLRMQVADGFKAGMSELGYVENKNVEYILKNSKRDADLQDKYIDELVAFNPDLIYITNTQGIKAAKDRGVKIPILFSGLVDPTGIVENLQHPEGNLTGILTGASKFADKRIELLKKIDPSIKRIIISPVKDSQAYPLFIESARKAAESLNVEIVELPSKNSKDFIARLPEIINRKNGDAFFYFPAESNAPNSGEERKKIVNHLIREKMISINHQPTGGAEEGVLASYGNDRFNVGHEASVFADQMLKGKSIKDIPVVFELGLILELNLATAKAIGIEIPQDVLSQAVKTYETY